MDKVVDKNRLLESSRWREFFQSVATGLQINITLLSDDGSYIMHTPEVCHNCGSKSGAFSSVDMARLSEMCKEELAEGKFISCSGNAALLQKLRNKLYIVVRECSCVSKLKHPGIEQRAGSAQKLLHSFLSLLNEEMEGGQRAVELLTLRQINHIIIGMFRGEEKTVELALDLILSALIIILDAKGCWVEYEKGGKTNLLVKGDKVLVEDYLSHNAGGAVIEKIDNDVVHGNIGVLLPENSGRASSLLPAMAQECLIAFEIEHLFQLMQSKLTHILGSIGSAVLLYDRNNEVCYANSSAGKLLGCEPLELIGRNAKDMDCPWTYAVIERVENAVSGTMDKLECSFEERWVDWQVCPIDDKYGVAGRIVIADDRTEFYKWLEAGKKAERMATIISMIGPLAHHLRNPLAAAKGLVQLAGQKKDPQKVMGYNNLILRELDRVICMLNEFLMLGKPASLDSEPMDLNSFFEELMPILIGEISGTEVELTTDFETVPPVLADSGQFTQVVLNLMRNSIEAVGNSGIIAISLKSREGWIEISFADSGSGISDEIMDKLFEPFFTTKERGTGLGLTISQAIVNNHGGYITASNSQDGGAVFTIRMPAVSYSQNMKHQIDIMLVSKDDILRSSIEQLLHMDGIHIISARDLSKAFSMNHNYCPKAIVIDGPFVNIDSVNYIRKLWPDVSILGIGEIKEQGSMYIESVSLPIEYSKFIDKVRSLLNFT